MTSSAANTATGSQQDRRQQLEAWRRQRDASQNKQPSSKASPSTPATPAVVKKPKAPKHTPATMPRVSASQRAYSKTSTPAATTAATAAAAAAAAAKCDRSTARAAATSSKQMHDATTFASPKTNTRPPNVAPASKSGQTAERAAATPSRVSSPQRERSPMPPTSPKTNARPSAATPPRVSSSPSPSQQQQQQQHKRSSPQHRRLSSPHKRASPQRIGSKVAARPSAVTAATKGGQVMARATVTPSRHSMSAANSPRFGASRAYSATQSSSARRAQPDAEEIRQRVLRASAKKAARLRRGEGNLNMKLGMLSVQSRIRETELLVNMTRTPQGGKVARNLAEELKAARTPEQNAASTDGEANQTDACDNGDSTSLIASRTRRDKTGPKRLKAQVRAELRLSMRVFQPAALRVMSQVPGETPTILPITEAPMLPWFSVEDARAAALNSEHGLARAMLSVIGTKPSIDTFALDPSVHSSPWPCQTEVYWIVRGKLEESCGDFDAAFHTFKEALSVFAEPSDELQQAFQMFTSRASRCGYNPPTFQHDEQTNSMVQVQPVALEASASSDEALATAITATAPPTSDCSSDGESSRATPRTSPPTNTHGTLTTSPTHQKHQRQKGEMADAVASIDEGLDALVLYHDDASNGSLHVPSQEGCQDGTPDETAAPPAESGWQTDDDGDVDMDDSDAEMGDVEMSGHDQETSQSCAETPLGEQDFQCTPHRIATMAAPHSAPASFTALTPVRASRAQQLDLGVNTVISPVRRSRRLLHQDDEDADGAPTKDLGRGDEERLARLLGEQGFAFVPNKALSPASPSSSTRRSSKATTPSRNR
ncbi:hypothetical protein THASP1DRAFT_29674 [Thamnocephalis sphaerospora]|uniref:Uncharacterized protein n=1 Tax=Thamnocephalis sphaerospora TaxID=78915 RepID=A0A4V1IWR9_9FUNG|nr:hypothetical protein THASP1DRAFT_29674 [Thamnocephalis sphaerospora]|eukprot:RKP08519.1 hypothetical protein THASP1DRAFT_29674 [Thamnocephalis sphaerospora]